VIHVTALLSSLLILLAPVLRFRSTNGVLSFPRLAGTGLSAFLLVTVGSWAITRGIFRDQQIGYAARHIRFGQDATATEEKPAADKPHP
jgi:hypothetical protein